MSQSSKLLSGGTWALYKIIAVQFINFGAIAILSRQLDPADFGIVALANVALRFFNVISAQGINQYIIYDNSANREEKLNAAFWLNLIFSLGSMIIGIVAIPWITDFYEEPLLASILLVLFLRFPIDVTSKLPDSILHKSLDFKPIEIRDTILQLAVAIFSVVMALTGFGVWALVIPSVIAAPIRLIIAFRIAKWRPHFKLYTEYWSEITKYSSNIIGGTFTNFILSQGDTLLVGRILGSAQLGVYNLSWTASNLVSKTLVTLTNKLAFPAFSAHKGDAEKVYTALNKVLFVIATLSFPILMWMLIAADNIILTLYGDKWVDAIIPFQILIIYAIRYSVGAPIGAVFKSMGRPDLNFKLGLIIIPFYFLGIIVGAKFGIIGVAIGVTISRSLVGLLTFWFGARLLGKGIGLIMKPLRKPFLHAAISCLVVLALDHFVTKKVNTDFRFVNMFISLAFMVVVYVTLAKLLFKETAEFIADSLQRITKGRLKLNWLK